jgi:hypothetical protein
LRTEPACLEGERACPPEDVGGVNGFFEFFKVLKNPSHEDRESYMEWPGRQKNRAVSILSAYPARYGIVHERMLNLFPFVLPHWLKREKQQQARKYDSIQGAGS